MELTTTTLIANIGYLFSIVLFSVGIKNLSKVKTARQGNQMAAAAMLLAISCQLLELGTVDIQYIIAGIALGALIGAIMAIKVEMTAMPELVAIFNGSGGIASALVALSLFYAADRASVFALNDMTFQGATGMGTAIAMVLSVLIGALTFTGSIVAYMKLADMRPLGIRLGNSILLPARHLINGVLILAVLAGAVYWVSFAPSAEMSSQLAIGLTALALILGILLVIPIGGADMPVVISLLNSYSGLAAAATGFALNSKILIVSGSLVGASGMILTMIMCKGMNRSLGNVMIGGFGGDTGGDLGNQEYTNVKSADSEEAAMDFADAQNVIIVPGYGLAVAQGQNAVREFADQLKERGCNVKYAIHPVAGRMPGHMNVLLAESNVPYDELFEMDAINSDFQATDIALVVGANDVVNPSAKDDKASPLYGMPVLNVEESRMVFVIKRSLSPGFAGVKNELFEKDNCRMIYGDAKKVLEELTTFVSEDD